MILKNRTNNETLLLPDDLLWVDEHQWTAATASVSYLLTGSLLVESASRQAGRPITLRSPTDMAWVTRASVNRLYSWAEQSQRQFELLLADGRTFQVAFRHHDTAMEAEPVLGFPTHSDTAMYRITLRLMEVV